MQLAGGTAAMQQMKERLEKDLIEVILFGVCFKFLEALTLKVVM